MNEDLWARTTRAVAEYTACPLTQCPACARTVATLVATSPYNPERLGAELRAV